MTILLSLSGVAITAAIVCAASAASGEAGAAKGAGPAEIGQPRPALEVDAIDQTLVNDARVAGRILIVDFFATWCQPCHRALADVTAARQAAGVDVQLVLVDLGEDPTLVRRWAATADLPTATIVALDPNGIVARRWGARRLPTTFIVDATGVVRHINRGWGPGYRNRMLRWLRQLRDASAAVASPHSAAASPPAVTATPLRAPTSATPPPAPMPPPSPSPSPPSARP